MIRKLRSRSCGGPTAHLFRACSMAPPLRMAAKQPAFLSRRYLMDMYIIPLSLLDLSPARLIIIESAVLQILGVKTRHFIPRRRGRRIFPLRYLEITDLIPLPQAILKK